MLFSRPRNVSSRHISIILHNSTTFIYPFLTCQIQINQLTNNISIQLLNHFLHHFKFPHSEVRHGPSKYLNQYVVS